MIQNINTVLFDLDGTLLDTAPDFIFVLNNLLMAKGRPTLPAEEIRNLVSHGSAALIESGFRLERNHSEFEELRQELLDLYSRCLTRFTRPFFGMESTLIQLAERKIRWGIVTNKPAWLTLALLEFVRLRPMPGVVVAGDSLAKCKPHPDPIVHALKCMRADANRCFYVGDAEVDVIAGKSAGVKTVVAEYGYIADPATSRSWQADAYIKAPLDLLQLL